MIRTDVLIVVTRVWSKSPGTREREANVAGENRSATSRAGGQVEVRMMTVPGVPTETARIVDAPPAQGDRQYRRCPRCLALDTMSLDRVDLTGNTCYRCRGCGHIFSPRA